MLFFVWIFFALMMFFFFPIFIFGGAGWWGFIKTASRARADEPIFTMFDTIMMLFGMLIYLPYLFWAGDRFFMTETSGLGMVIAYLINLSPILLGGVLLVQRFLLKVSPAAAADPTQTAAGPTPDHRTPPPAV